MSKENTNNRASKMVGMLFVVAIHIGLLYLAMSYKLIPAPQEAVTLMVNLINPPKKEEPPPPPEPPKPVPPKEVKLVKEKPIVKPKPTPVLVAQAPVVAPSEPVAPPAPPEPVKEEPAPPVPAAPAPEPVKESKPAAPVQMSELSVGCSSRPEPSYPAASRRTGEQGSVKLRVELDEEGHISSVKVVESSGHPRLDNAGVNTIKNWKCEAATRDGKPARAIATQVFDFKLEEN